MKPKDPTPAVTTDPAAASPPPAAADAHSSGLGLAERRSLIRPLPVAEVTESDGDTDWAAFQELMSDRPKE